ncbi:MFS transporter [Leucobacter komagatae]|uniref:MFS transporter n=1 Tax=Leucobacter komagatae TaxID=55969 RepID=A0A0D0IMS3_9MICO|nr:MFS transporter [Leucobacter komagatae]KIP52879.1 MFS transporter [Leucobacter komagatae]
MNDSRATSQSAGQSTTPQAAPPHGTKAPVSRARRWGALVVLSASLFVIMMDMTILNIALPRMAAELHPTSDQQLWIIDVYALVLAGLLVSFAALADRWGRKRMLMLGYTIFGLASLLVLFANSAESVIMIRALLGIGGAMIMPTTLSLIRVLFTDPRERATALSIWAAVSGLGAAVGPLVGGVLLEHFSWHAAFLVNVPLMVVGVIAGIIVLPESRVKNPGRWDFIAAILSLAGMTLAVWAIKKFAAAATFLVPAALIAFALAVVLLAWFVIRCLRSSAPLLELALFKNRPFSAGIIAALGSSFAMGAALLLLAQWMQIVDGATPIEAGVRLVPVAIAGAIASLAAPPFARVIGARAVLAGGIALAGIGMVAIGVQPGELSNVTVILALSLVGFGTGSLAIGSAMIMHGTPEEKAGSAGALEETSYELGSVLGVAILGSIASLLYRAGISGSPELAGLGAEGAQQANNSLGAAAAIAEEFGLPELLATASDAFTESMQTTGIIGGLTMLAIATLVFFLTPKGTDVSEGGH